MVIKKSLHSCDLVYIVKMSQKLFSGKIHVLYKVIFFTDLT